MSDLDQLIKQVQADLKALEKSNRATGKKSTQAQQLRQQLGQLQARLEANHEQSD